MMIQILNQDSKKFFIIFSGLNKNKPKLKNFPAGFLKKSERR